METFLYQYTTSQQIDDWLVGVMLVLASQEAYRDCYCEELMVG